jgi:hypothetical protein
MRWRYILNTVGVLILFFGGTMVVPLAFDLFAMDRSLLPLIKAMGATLAAVRRPDGCVSGTKKPKPSASGKAWPSWPWDGRPSACSARCPFIFPIHPFSLWMRSLNPFPGLPPPVHRF